VIFTPSTAMAALLGKWALSLVLSTLSVFWWLMRQHDQIGTNMCTSVFVLVPRLMDLGGKHLKEASRTHEKTQDIKNKVYERSYSAAPLTGAWSPDGPALRKCRRRGREDPAQIQAPDGPAPFAGRYNPRPQLPRTA